ncbi:MAG: ABC transporter substrate-binding protein [Acidimicrobiaceae bacterium]|nr:ABC transporter substrate-binding protein [Acidimicrobiaceae bacterium]
MATVMAVGALAGMLTPGAVGATASAAGSGGNLMVLANSGSFTWRSLDPATGTGFLAYPWYMNAIYGELFQQGPKNKPIPDLATGYSISKDGKTVTIRLRHGVKFTDGTPFNAAAVKFNIDRDLSPASADACGCALNYPIKTITTPDQYTVVLHMKTVFAPIIQAFFNDVANWIASPTALQKMGVKQFSITPVGAGPFMVKSDKVGAQLQLVKNPNYWQKGFPKLNSLTFGTIGSDESAFEALQAGQTQVIQSLGTATIAQQAATAGFRVKQTGVSNNNPSGVQFNTTVAPFNNIKAREAIYYATDPQPINKALLLGKGTLTQTMTGPASLFFEPKVPGYRTYNLAKAKALVQQLGGLKFSLLTNMTPTNVNIITALKAEWAKAGIQTTLNPQVLGNYINLEMHNQWQIALQGVGGLDPAIGFGLSFRFETNGPFTGVKNPNLDKLINAGVVELNPEKRLAIYKQAYKLVSDQAYIAMLFTIPTFNISAKKVSGPGLSTSNDAEILWQDVTMK